MKSYLLCILVAAAIFGLSVQSVLAAPAHHHSAPVKHEKGISPFDGKAPSHKLHCILLGHSMMKPCPVGSEGQKVPCELSRPCHNGPVSGSTSSSGSGNFGFAAAWFHWGPVLPSSVFNPRLISLFDSHFISPLEHPPRSV